MAVALDIIKNKTGLDDALAQQALDVKNKDGVEAFKDFVTKNKPIQPANPPVTPPTPTPTGQTIQGVNGENFQVAPTNPNTGLSQPAPNTVAPTPVVPEPIKAPEPIKTEVTSTKIEPVVDFTKADGRESEIKTNVEGFIKSGMTPDKVKEASGYEMASPEKKAIIDGIIGGQVKPNADQIFTSLKQGVSVGDPKSIEFRQAQARVNTFKKFSTYDTASLATSLSSGDLLVGTRAYNDLVSDPTMSAKIQKAQAFNKGEVDLVKVGETQMANVLAQNPTVANALDDNFISQDEYNKLTNNAEVSAQGKLVETNKTKYETIKAKYDAVEDEVDSEFTGKEVTDSFKAKIVADRRKGMYKDYQIASLEYQNSLGTYTNLKADATALLAQNMELYKDQKAQEAEIAKEQRTMQNSLALSQMQYDQKIAQQAQAMGTPELAIPSVIEQYASQGVFASTSPQEHIARAKALIAKGGTLGEYISQMQKDFQAKDSYRAKFTGNLNDTQKLLLQSQLAEKSDIRNFNQQKELARMSNDSTREQFLFEIENDPAKRLAMAELETKLNANKSLFDVLGKNVGTYEGNRGYDLAGKLGDPMPAGGNWKVESIIDTNYSSSPYGNSVVMVDENGNKVRYSHLQSIGVKPGDQLGFGDIVGTRGNTGNVKGANGETLTQEQLKAGRGAHLDVEIKDSKGNLLSQSQQVEWLKNKKANIAPQYDANALAIANGVGDLADLTATDKKTILPQIEAIVNSRMTDDPGRNSIIKSALYKKDISDSTLQKLTDMESVKGQLSSIENRLSKQSVGPILGALKKYNPYDTEAQVAMAELAGLTPKVARGIFGEVGVLTDTDIANYQKTLPNLTSTEEKNKFVIEFMRNLLARGVMKTIETQAKGQRNMSAFIEDYDNAKKYIEKGTTTPSNEDENDWNDASNL